MTSADEVRRWAEDYFAQGYYCAESVLMALARANGTDSPVLPRIASGFCSGMARTCGPCGALTGAIMGLGLMCGRDAPEQSVQKIYQATQQLVQAFEQEFGARDCDVLLGCDLGTEEGQAFFRQAGLMQMRCALFTARAAQLAAQISADIDRSEPQEVICNS